MSELISEPFRPAIYMAIFIALLVVGLRLRASRFPNSLENASRPGTFHFRTAITGVFLVLLTAVVVSIGMAKI